MNERVMTVDPGKTVGWTLWRGNEDVVIDQDEHTAFLRQAHKLIALRSVTVVVVEDFVITAATLRKAQGQLWALEIRGVLRYLCREYGVRFEIQRAADAKKFVDNDKLKQLGWYVKGKEHSRDAARHLALYLVRENLLDPRCFVASK